MNWRLCRVVLQVLILALCKFPGVTHRPSFQEALQYDASLEISRGHLKHHRSQSSKDNLSTGPNARFVFELLADKRSYVDPNSAAALIPKQDIDEIDGQRLTYARALAWGQTMGRGVEAAGGATELLASIASAYDFPYPWGIVYMTKHIVTMLLTRDTSFSMVFKKLMDALAKEAVFGYENCPAPNGTAAAVFEYANCASSFVIAVLNYGSNSLGWNGMLAPVVSILTELATIVKDIWEHGISGENLWALGFTLTRMVIFLFVGATWGYAADAAVLMAEPKLQALATQVVSGMKATFSSQSIQSKLKYEWMDADRVGRDCTARIALLATKVDRGLTSDLSPGQLVDVPTTTAFVAATIGSRNDEEPAEVRDLLASGMSGAVPQSSAFDVFLVQQHVRQGSEGKSMVYNYNDLLDRYSKWYKLRMPHPQQQPDAQDLAVMQGLMLDDTPTVCTNGRDPRCTFACEAAVLSCSGAALQQGDNAGIALKGSSDDWSLPSRPGWCFPRKR